MFPSMKLNFYESLPICTWEVNRIAIYNFGSWKKNINVLYLMLRTIHRWIV